MMSKRILPSIRDFVQVLMDGWGKPDVHDEEGIRSLQFSGGAIQSSMRLSEPFELDLSYTRAMMGFMLFIDDPQHILLVGLGGGSLSKYCHQQFPQARITTLEINPDVIALREKFLMPPDSERFVIQLADAAEYLTRSDLHADVILLDGYDAEGLPRNLCSESFYSNCWNALSTQGVLVANIWSGESSRETHVDRLRGIFNGRVWWSRPRNSTNLIVFAVKNEHFYPKWSRLIAKAQTLSTRYRLDLTWLVKNMRLRVEPDD